LKTCSLYVSAFVSISSCESGLRVTLRPVGSPISAVESPIRKMTVVPELLEVAQLADQHGVSQMQVRRGGIEPRLDAHGHARRPRLRDALAQRLQRNDLRRPLRNQVQLLVNRRKRRHIPQV